MFDKIKFFLFFLFNFLRKIIFYFFILLAIVSLFDKELGLYASFWFLLLSIIFYPEIITKIKNKLKGIKVNDKKNSFNSKKTNVKQNALIKGNFIINKFFNNNFKNDYKGLFNKIIFDNINNIDLVVSDINNITTKYDLPKDRIIFDLFKDIFNYIKVKNELNINEKNMLLSISKLLSNNNVYKSKIIKLLKDYYNFIISDYKITDLEKELFEEFLNIFNIDLDKIGFNQNEFSRYYAIYLLEDKGQLPELNIIGDLPIILKKIEKLYWVEEAYIYKKKLETIRANYYTGGSASIKIAKGIRFSVGNYSRPSYKQEVTYLEDKGYFVITNQRVGFVGEKQNFFIKYDKIINFQLIDDGLLIMKENRQKPYIITLNDYKISLILLSKILNNEI